MTKSKGKNIVIVKVLKEKHGIYTAIQALDKTERFQSDSLSLKDVLFLQKRLVKSLTK